MKMTIKDGLFACQRNSYEKTVRMVHKSKIGFGKKYTLISESRQS